MLFFSDILTPERVDVAGSGGNYRPLFPIGTGCVDRPSPRI